MAVVMGNDKVKTNIESCDQSMAITAALSGR
jgi:hypothetical protein